MQVCTSLQSDNHASTPPLNFLQTGCPSCRPTNSVKALKDQHNKQTVYKEYTEFLSNSTSRVQLPTYADNVALPAFADCTPLLQQLIDISCPQSPQQQTYNDGFDAKGPCYDRQTDGEMHQRRTLYHFIVPAPHTTWVVPIT